MNDEPEYNVGSSIVPEYEIGMPTDFVQLNLVQNITLHELVEYTPEDFFIVMGGHPCLWCRGYLIAYTPVNPEFFDRALNNGVRWYRHIDYAPLPKFEKTIKTTNNMEVSLINYSDSPIGNLMIDFIENYRKHKDE